jgi:hypothetical protein
VYHSLGSHARLEIGSRSVIGAGLRRTREEPPIGADIGRGLPTVVAAHNGTLCAALTQTPTMALAAR